MDNGFFAAFNFHTCFDCSVSVEYFLLLNDFGVVSYLVFKSSAVTPMYQAIFHHMVVFKNVPVYKVGSRRCKNKNNSLLNKRFKLFSKCRRETRYLISHCILSRKNTNTYTCAPPPLNHPFCYTTGLNTFLYFHSCYAIL